jgi:diguanylate cyclase (GGDEF)-like protein
VNTAAQPPPPNVVEGGVRGRSVSWRRTSIISKLALLVLAVGLPLVGILAWSLVAQFELDRRLAEQHAVRHAIAAATRAQGVVEQTRSILRAVAERPAVKALDPGGCDPFLAELRASLPHYANINTFNLRWEFVCSASLLRGRIVRSAYPALYERMKARGDMVLSAAVRGQLTGRMVVIAAYPIRDAEGVLLGAVTAPIEVSALRQSLEPGDGHDVAMQLVDAAGAVIVRHPGGERGELIVAAPRQPGPRGVSVAVDRGGIERIHALAPVQGTDWIVTAAPPTASELAESGRRRMQVIAATLLAFALSAWVALILSRRITRPLRELERDARILAGGKFGHRSAVAGPDEVGQLAAAFNDMGRAVQQHEAAILRDITERNRSDLQIRRLNRVHAVLSGINALIVRVQGRDELFREACRIAVDDGGFVMAWIGMVDRAEMKLVPVASAGSTTDFLTLVNQRFSLLEDSPYGNVLSAVAIRGKKATFSNDVQSDPKIAFRAEHAKRGSRSLAILPLLVADDAVGVLALYAGETGAFDEEEMRLLSELAGDIAFAIDHIEKQDRLNYLAYYDPLTGLANRTLFLERVDQSLRGAASGGHKLALFLMDLERFRNINDSLGRPAGDALLKQVAQWMVRIAGDAALVARVDADHFALMLPEVRPDGNLPGLVEKASRSFLEHPFRLDDAVFRIAARAGVAVYPDDGADAETLFRNAEAALKKAKTGGDRYLFHTQKMTQAAAGRLTLENQLRQAVDKGEFVLHYQPKVSLAGGKLTGAEALIRWNDPRTGLVPPGRFIPMLEETGLIFEVGRWALRQAIADYLRWKARGLPAVRIAVNVSPLQLRHRGFIAEIGELIGIDAQAAAGLELEITESLIMQDVRNSIASMQAIRAMGVKVAIDDFGTGFSSLSYLARLPVDTLKIDRSFVLDMTAGPQGLALVSIFIKLAHSLKLGVVAEGVETEEQSRLLALLGCDEMQGNFRCEPLPVALFEAEFLQ